jgi:predicted DNA-binding transcriptional regulator AlpA
MASIISIPEKGFVRISQILNAIPVGRSTWWQWVRDGKAPQSIKLGERTTVWRAEDIAAFIEKFDRRG